MICYFSDSYSADEVVYSWTDSSDHLTIDDEDMQIVGFTIEDATTKDYMYNYSTGSSSGILQFYIFS